MNTISPSPLRVRHQNPLRLLEVSAVDHLSPRMRRITFTGEGLDNLVTAAADDHVKLFFPAPGQSRPVLPVPGASGPAHANAGPAPIMRDYTPRRLDRARRELQIEFVLHGTGPASDWAAQAIVGQCLGVGGPRGSFLLPDADGRLLVGDESALPAIARFLEELAAGVPAAVFIEVENRDEERHLPTAAHASITWLHRNGAAPGDPGLLLDALGAAARPTGHVQAWVAGEIGIARAVRGLLTERFGLARSQIRAAGYWRTGAAGVHERIEEE